MEKNQRGKGRQMEKEMDKQMEDYIKDSIGARGGYRDDKSYMQDVYMVFDMLVYGVEQCRQGVKQQADERKAVKKDLSMLFADRQERTPGAFVPFLGEYIRKKGISMYWVLIIVAAGACHYDALYEDVFAELSGNPQNIFACKAMVEEICTVWDIPVENNYERTQLERELFLEDGSTWSLACRKTAPLVLKPWIADLFWGRRTIPDCIAGKIGLLDKEEDFEWIGYSGQEEQLRRILSKNGPQINAVISGKKGCGKETLVRYAAGKEGAKVIFLPWDLYEEDDEKQELLDNVLLYAKFMEANVCLLDCSWKRFAENEGGIRDGYRIANLADGLNSQGLSLMFTTVKDGRGMLETMGGGVAIRLGVPEADERILAWDRLSSKYPIEDIPMQELGNKYRMHIGEIADVLRTAWHIAQSRGRGMVLESDIVTAVRQKNDKELGPFAEWLPPCFHWEDLVVDGEVKKRLSHIANRLLYRNVVGGEWGYDKIMPYGRGICSLFYGPPGTGKTMAARVLANELGIDLYRVDLSRMMSKYVGETQKNITQLFEKAKDIDALLLFDEADAFFSRRTKVSDANDRNANSEVAHLLQKIEEYEGISVLATNIKGNIDQAFLRRFKYMVHFQLPTVSERKELWRKMLPEAAPREEGINLDFFAEKFELSGSEIKEIMAHAAYSAASRNKEIGKEEVVESVRLCMDKYGVVLKQADFRGL